LTTFKMKTTTLAITAISLVAQLAAAQPHRIFSSIPAIDLSNKLIGHKHAKKQNAVVTVIDTVYAMAQGPEVVVFVNQFGEPVSTMTEGMLENPPSIWSTKHGKPTTSVAPSSSAAASTTSSSSSSSTFVTIASTPSSAAPAISPAVIGTIDKVEKPAAVTSAVVPTINNVEKPAAVTSAVVPAIDNVEKAAATTSPVVVAPVEKPTPVKPASTSAPAPAQSSDSSSSAGGVYGVSYSPYNSDNSCKTQAQVLTDFAKINNEMTLSGALIRTYGTDCGQVGYTLTAAKKYNFKMFVGIYDLTPANLASEVAIITSATAGDWSNIDTVSVGNEAVNDGTFSPAAVVAAISTVRSLLKSAGFTGSVVTVDTLVAMIANPTLCDNSDYCAANCHPFFDGGVAADGAGDFLSTQIPRLSAVLANKNQKILITETGWPSQGSSNGAAVPSTANQAAALKSIKSTFADDPAGVILFTAFNDMWKASTAATFHAEPYWGIFGSNPTG
jgi:exo-beta-1,3-glucanase (GH17 family)